MQIKRTLNVKEAAELLGVSRRTVERAIQSGELDSFKFRDNRRIDIDEVQKFKKKDSNEVNP